MADNVTLNSGSGGSSLATDDVTDAGGAHYQRVKLTDGTANSETHVHSGNGTSTNALRVTVSSDSTGVLSVDDNGGALTVDNAGTFVVQEDGAALTALQLIDDVVHVDDAAYTLGTDSGVMMMGFAGTQSVNANDAGAIAMETDGSIHIHDGGNTITVDGTVTANLGATDNAVLDTIATNTTGLNGTVSGSELQVDVVAALPAGANTIGEVTIGAASTAAGDLGKAEDAVHGSGDVGVMALAVRNDTLAQLAGTDGDYAPVQVDAAGAVYAAPVATKNGGSGLHTNNGTSTLTQVIGSATQLYWLHVINLKASVLYLQVFDLASGSVTLGTTTPDMVFPIPTQGDTNGAGFALSIGVGVELATALSYAVTTTKGGATTASADEAFVNLGYAK